MPDILELARECGAKIASGGPRPESSLFYPPMVKIALDRLSELERRIREDERELAAKVCDELHQRQLDTMTEHNYHRIAAAAIRRGGA